MLFNSIDFLIFFPIVILGYLVIPPKVRYLWLLIASYYFYMCWQPAYALLLLTSTMVTFSCGWWIYKAKNSLLKKTAVAAGIFVNLGILFYFKYFDFFLDSLNKVLGKLNITLIQKGFDVLLPVGISFYIFQALGYMIDVYREKLQPEKNPFRYALFVSFFPQLVAGPIERSSNLLRQLRELDTKKVLSYENITQGLTMMIWGLFEKMVIADRIAILVDSVFETYYLYGTVELLLGAVAFAIQIYCDFCGYSAVAIGAAKVMGITLMENFETPYFARSISEFWRRWHISLSTWFRDYVYIPLGGNRCSKPRKYFNLMVTFAISGLWHGANWNYVAWGLIHGFYQVAGNLTKEFRVKIYQMTHTKMESFSFRFGQALVTFVMVDFAWIFFRARGIKEAFFYILRMITVWNPWKLFDGSLYKLGLEMNEIHILIVSLVVLFLTDLIRYYKKKNLAQFLETQCIWFRWSVVFALLFAILIYGIYGVDFDSTQFVYFQF